ncbi:MAG: chorismate--pyruvate lyase family protein [Nitrospiria bacterium]
MSRQYSFLDKDEGILYSTAMNPPFSLACRKFWPDHQSFINDSKKSNLSPLIRILLTSGGTLTNGLQSLLMGPVYLEVANQMIIEIDNETAQFLGLKEQEKAIFREVWLLNDQKKRMVYARSYLPMNSLDPFLLQQVQLKSRAIGDLIDSSNLPSLKDKMTFSKIESAFLAGAFDIPEETSMWSRRYRLIVQNCLLASIQEFFSPFLFET